MFPFPRRNTVARQAKYRERLPQLGGGLFLTDGGLETTLIFREGWELPRFEAFVLLNDLIGCMVLRAYFDRYVLMAIEAGAGFLLDARQSAMQWRCHWQSHRIKRTTSLSSNRSRQEAALATRQREARIARPGRPRPNRVSARRDRTVSSNHLETRQALPCGLRFHAVMKKVSQLPNWFRPNHPRDLPLA